MEGARGMGVQLGHAFPSICIMTRCIMIPVNLTVHVDHSVSDNLAKSEPHMWRKREREREREGGEEERKGREDTNHHIFSRIPST